MAINVYFLSPFRGLGGLFSTFCLLPFAFCLLPFISVYRLEEDDTLCRRGWCEDRISTGKLVFMENHELIASGAFSTHPLQGVYVGFCSLYPYFAFRLLHFAFSILHSPFSILHSLPLLGVGGLSTLYGTCTAFRISVTTSSGVMLLASAS